MGVVRVISDLHFGHRNMAIWRGFDSVEEHDNHIIEMWNKTVSKRDTVWVLGDITMEKKDGYRHLSKLQGIIKVVMGNHDKIQHSKELIQYVRGVAGMVKYKQAILTHCPVHPRELNHRFIKNIHGHVHEATLDDPRYENVCCEVINYTPVEIDLLLQKEIIIE